MGLLLFFILWGFGFLKDVLNVEILNLDTKNIRCFFVDVFLCKISSWNCYRKHDMYNWLKWIFFAGGLVILAFSWNIFYTLDSFPHENSCRISFKCHVCGNSSRWYVTPINIYKKPLIFLATSWWFQHFRLLLQNAKAEEMTNESSSPIPPKKS